MTSTKWRNIEKNENFENKNIIEGAEFEIFNDQYWNGKDQLGPSNISSDIKDFLEKLRKYLASPARLIDEGIFEIIYNCLSIFVKYETVDCSANIIKDNQESPLIDPNLLWLSESFENIKEGFGSSTYKIGGVVIGGLNSSNRAIKTINDLQKIIDEEAEPESDAHDYFVNECNENMVTAKEHYEETHRRIYEMAIGGYLQSLKNNG